jgi:hypothetical protein
MVHDSRWEAEDARVSPGARRRQYREPQQRDERRSADRDVAQAVCRGAMERFQRELAQDEAELADSAGRQQGLRVAERRVAV